VIFQEKKEIMFGDRFGYLFNFQSWFWDKIISLQLFFAILKLSR